ncbi:hypothetical protein HNY73_000738 [Argiope bruennichi]|uniref:Uncharacterized protein n=1 Tax=Argiope bruennichi TaxID=94029 RepID=A0A8T0G1H6_ARGBR|nr:hypothetical protein HNY73_000738 [Argiope bruennichi]
MLLKNIAQYRWLYGFCTFYLEDLSHGEKKHLRIVRGGKLLAKARGTWSNGQEGGRRAEAKAEGGRRAEGMQKGRRSRRREGAEVQRRMQKGLQELGIGKKSAEGSSC